MTSLAHVSAVLEDYLASLGSEHTFAIRVPTQQETDRPEGNGPLPMGERQATARIGQNPRIRPVPGEARR